MSFTMEFCDVTSIAKTSYFILYLNVDLLSLWLHKTILEMICKHY